MPGFSSTDCKERHDIFQKLLRDDHPWSVGAFTELVSGTDERDIVFAVGAGFYPLPRLSLVVAPGLELVEKDVEEHGEFKKEKEKEFLVRIGAAYGFPVGNASLGPSAFADWAGDRWTIVYGVAMVTGF